MSKRKKRDTTAYVNKISDNLYEIYEKTYDKITEKAKGYGVGKKPKYSKTQFLKNLNAYKNTLNKTLTDKETGKKVHKKHYTYEELAGKVAKRQYYKYSVAQARKYRDIMNNADYIEIEGEGMPTQKLEAFRMKGLDEVTVYNMKSDAADLRRKHRMFLEGKATDQEWGEYNSTYIANFIAKKYFGSN